MQKTSGNSETKNKAIHSNMDFDLDAFDFRPVTKGLGFHKDKQIEKPARVFNKSTRTSHSEISRSKLPTTSININNNFSRTESPKRLMVNEQQASTQAPLQASFKTARMGVQFTAFIFDLVIISSLQMAVNLIFLKLVNLTDIVSFIEFTWLEQTIFFSFIFLLYFSVLDLVSTPGKKIFGMSLKSQTDKNVKIDQTLIRSMVTLLSIVLIFMPLLFDFQGKLSDSKVIEDV